MYSKRPSEIDNSTYVLLHLNHCVGDVCYWTRRTRRVADPMTRRLDGPGGTNLARTQSPPLAAVPCRSIFTPLFKHFAEWPPLTPPSAMDLRVVPFPSLALPRIHPTVLSAYHHGRRRNPRTVLDSSPRVLSHPRPVHRLLCSHLLGAFASVRGRRRRVAEDTLLFSSSSSSGALAVIRPYRLSTFKLTRLRLKMVSSTP